MNGEKEDKEIYQLIAICEDTLNKKGPILATVEGSGYDTFRNIIHHIVTELQRKAFDKDYVITNIVITRKPTQK